MSRQAGDKEAFERIHRQTFDRLAAYVLARADRDVAADAIARTYEIAWRRRAELPREPIGWLIGTARRVLADGRRSERRRDALVERIARTSSTSAEDHLGSLARRDSAVRALSRLTHNQREALLLIAWEGLSEKQASAALGCSRGAFALRVHRARKAFRRELERGETDDVAPVRAAATKEAT
ncbi:MAG TPA: sigma-70 family RNA polymerase sigma factor [Solirubrobacteraceae bacterium]|jgi:RNA polymerase sigma-70 factor (ECF subfamily)